MNKINKKPAFSLMEVMIILLIMAVTLAATAPMISRKMSRNVGTAEEPWKFTGADENISFNGEGRDNSTVFIGTDRIRNAINNTTTANIIPLYICMQNNRPAIELGLNGRFRRGGGFVDLNGNGQQDANEVISDLNGDGRWIGVDDLQAQIDNLQTQIDALDPVNDAAQIAALQAQIQNFNNQIAALNTLPDNVARGFIGITHYNRPLVGDVYIPYISNVIPSNNSNFMGIILGNRIRLFDRNGNAAVNGNVAGGISNEEVADKIIIGHDSQIDSFNNWGGATSFMNPERIILIGSDNLIRGKDIIAIGRGVDTVQSFRLSVRNSVLISSGRPSIPINNIGQQAIAFSTWYSNGANNNEDAQFRTIAMREITLNNDANFDQAFDSVANNNHSNNVQTVNRVVSGITAICQNMFSSGIGHTQIGNQAIGGRVDVNGNFMPYFSSFTSVAIGNSADAAGSDCVAIGHNILAGFPRTNNDSASRELPNLLRNSRNSTVVIGVPDNDFLDTAAARAVAIGTGVQTNDPLTNTLIDDHTGKIAIGEDAEANSKYAIAIGPTGDQNTVASNDYSIALGNGARALANNAIAIGHNANAQARHANSVAIGAGATTTVNNLADNIPRIVLGTGGHTVVIPGTLRVNPANLQDLNGQRIIAQADGTLISDIRLKNVGEKLTSGLEDIKKLEFFNYTFKDDKEQKPHVGVMAQDLQKVFPTSVTEGSDGYLRIRWDEMFYAALNAIKELDCKIIALAQDVKSFFERVDSIDLRVAQHQKALDDLKSDFADIDARLKALEE